MRKLKLPEHLEEGLVFLPRVIVSHKLSGELTLNEYNFLVYIYISSNPYGKCRVSNIDLSEQFFGSKNKSDYAGKIMSSLKSKKRVFFDERQGKTGMYEVKTIDFVTSKGTITKYPDQDSEVITKVPKIQQPAKPTESIESTSEQNGKLRSDNKENKKDKKINNMNELRDFLSGEVKLNV